MNSETGGPAFPMSVKGQSTSHEAGMTLRDYFAAKAMQGIAARGVQNTNGDIIKFIADDAYRLADAMLKARGES